MEGLTDLDKKKMGIAIALSLPEEGINSIQDKVFSNLSLEALNADDGIDKLIEFMDKIFKKDELSEAYEAYSELDRFRRNRCCNEAPPLLLSKDSMKKAKMKLDLENDSANIFGKDVQLQCTSSGHYCVPIDQLKIYIKVTATALVATQMTKDKTKIIEKLHKQFAHPSAKRL
ncbi:unnamed protein product [Mytilus coruscus]|uniref:Uncharacterized protein n=1 Tax=Mytilus coruscus TaxID=42192 RepID=A0A6J8DTH0_MYTCO|nr:unnamed protein product [Mytilus coruscus]